MKDESYAYVNHGKQQIQYENYAVALRYFNQAIAINSNLVDAWNGRGVALKNLQQFQDALDAYNQAIKLDYRFYKAWHNKGLLLEQLDRDIEALGCYDALRKLRPDFQDARQNYQKLHKKLSKQLEEASFYDTEGIKQLIDSNDKKALEFLDKALSIQPDKSSALWFRMQILIDRELYEDALIDGEKALLAEISPLNRFSGLLRLGECSAQLGFHEKTISYCNQLLATNAESTEPNPFARVAILQSLCNTAVAQSGLGQYENAIDTCDQVLANEPNDYRAWLARGQAASNLQSRRNPPFSYLPAEMQEQKLSLPGYQGALASFHEGLKYVQQDKEPKGFGLLHRNIGDAHYGHRLSPENRTRCCQLAVNSYETALESLAEQQFTKERLSVLQNLIRPLTELGWVETSQQKRSEGLRIFRELYNRSSAIQKKKLVINFSGFSQLQVDRLVEDELPITAWETAERYKNDSLTWILNRWDEKQYSPSYQQIQSLLKPTTAVIYWHSSSISLTTFIIKSKVPEPLLLFTDESSRQQLKELNAWIAEWDYHYDDYRSKGKEKSGAKKNHSWRDGMKNMLKRLEKILDVATIETALNDITHLVLIPHRDLHRFPLHTLFEQRFTTTYLPSAQIGLTLQSYHPNTIDAFDGLSLLSVDNPSNDLPKLKFASVESDVICQLWGNTTAIVEETATHNIVMNALQQPYSLFHFTGHGGYNSRHPENSALALTKNDRVTAKEISQNLPHGQYQLVSLAACETALTGRQTIETEYVGLVSAFLQAGSAYVVSTLWEVEDDANAWFMIRFYQLLKQELSPALALKQTQDWLRNVSLEELSVWLQSISGLEGLKPVSRDYLRVRANNLIRSGKMDDYSDPYYWAAFTLTGKAFK